ncbi:tyrosine-protein phosphatase [Paenibacillus agilis]|uniref:Tyrosine-protein phosphatase n=1 Tax=Paenibacillus agilis TaxID=3020863 RepID=A0A559J194_9BACL|nr:CpsB/CapC family capsule biosynthesis tyrosine phosphatase [Paenibacillus agilis]TVX93611.1 tyrosine protein phosphatase [Paenibacillus agilis]
MIDIHTHILPCLDDGAPSLEVAVLMARIAYAQGIRGMIATPHHRNGRYRNEAADIYIVTALLNEALQQQGVDVTVYAGQEIHMYDSLLLDWIEGKTLLSLHRSKYVLIELPATHIPTSCRDLFYELRLLGMVPIIAHPERNAEVMKDVGLLAELVREGALCQVTASSLTGRFGSKVRKLAWKLCKQNFIHFIASDCHNCRSRPPDLANSYQQIGEVLGERHVQNYMLNASNVLQNKDIAVQEPVLSGSIWRMSRY